MQIELSAAEREVLAELLSAALADLREQVYKTERHEFRDALKQRKAVVERLLDRLRVIVPA